MKFNTDEIASVLREEIDRFESGIDVREVGRVLEVGDGIDPPSAGPHICGGRRRGSTDSRRCHPARRLPILRGVSLVALWSTGPWWALARRADAQSR
jgi:hypothetical protein